MSVHICSFSEGLDELPKKKRTANHVLLFLKERGRFSVFEATAKADIASLLDWLGDKGYYKQKPESRYPWCEVEITEAGERFLAESVRKGE